MSRKYRLLTIIGAVLFFLLNIGNGFLLTFNVYNRYIMPYVHTVPMIASFWFGDFVFLAASFGLILLIPRAKVRYILYFVVTCLYSLFCFGVSIFNYNYGMMASYANFDTFGASPPGASAGFVFRQLGALLSHANYWTLVPIGVALAVMIPLLYFAKREPGHFPAKQRKFLAASALLVFFFGSLTSFALFNRRVKETWYAENRDGLYGIQYLGMYNYYHYDFYRYYFTNDNQKALAHQEEIKAALASHADKSYRNAYTGALPSQSPYYGVFQNKNLILIQAESLNNYVVGLKVAGQEVTPNTNALIADGVYFNEFYNVAGIGNTSDAEFSVMTGLYPNGENVSINRWFSPGYATLPQAFKRAGYTTTSLHGNVPEMYNRGEVHREMFYFDRHFPLDNLPQNYSLVHTWTSDADLLEQAARRVANTPERDFVFPITISCHTPFMNDPEIDRVLAEAGIDFSGITAPMFRGYLEHCFYVDWAIGKFIETLERLGIKEEVVIGLYGDHGAGIALEEISQTDSTLLSNALTPLDENLFADKLAAREDLSREEAAYLINYAYRKMNQQVPFIIYEGAAVKKLPPQTISLVRSQIDIKHTFANLFGLPAQSYYGIDALSDDRTFAYNPRNFDIFTDEGMYTAANGWCYKDGALTMEKTATAQLLITKIRDYRALNDKIVKYITINGNKRREQ